MINESAMSHGPWDMGHGHPCLSEDEQDDYLGLIQLLGFAAQFSIGSLFN